jgi:hypothetical protein
VSRHFVTIRYFWIPASAGMTAAKGFPVFSCRLIESNISNATSTHSYRINPLWKRGARGDLRPRKIPLNPPFPKGEVKAGTAKRPQTRVRIARTTVALLLRSSIINRSTSSTCSRPRAIGTTSSAHHLLDFRQIPFSRGVIRHGYPAKELVL